MSQPPDIDLEATSKAERLSGGRSARLAALVVGGVLVAVVWIGMSGRSAPIPPSPTAPAIAAAPTPLPTAAGTAAPVPLATPGPIDLNPDGEVAVGAGDVFGVIAEFGFNQYITILAEPEPGHLVGRLLMRLPIPESQGTFVFQQFSTSSAQGQPVHIASWPLDVRPVARGEPEMVVINASVPARRSRVGAPRPVISGFRLTVSAERDTTTGDLWIDVKIGGNRRLVGNDGIFGWPTVANIAALRPPLQYTRQRGVYNYCRWELSPLSAPPRPGTDEANC